MKKYAVLALVTVVTMAVVYRVPQARKAVTGA